MDRMVAGWRAAVNRKGSTDLFWRMGLVHKKASGKAQTAAIPRGMARICNAAGRFFMCQDRRNESISASLAVP
ncbi:hypothetical protein ACFOHT_09165 [Massilia oculi]|uniref:hypothetical protein n=1 Tax=Massilia oculi TaxID=945844 RepID=UPI0013B3FC54|nr:hypothetical protein [Massilia oculi]